MFRRNNFKQTSDEDLLVALQRGRLRALEELYLRYEENLRYYFFRMTGKDIELARDLCQDLFVRVAEKADTFHRQRSFKTWLYSIAHNMCKNHYRHLKVVEEAHEKIAGSVTALPAASILDKIDASIFRSRIDATLLEVDRERRSTFLLRHREGLSMKEIADIQDCPLGTIKSRLHHVHQLLARELADLKTEI